MTSTLSRIGQHTLGCRTQKTKLQHFSGVNASTEVGKFIEASRMIDNKISSAARIKLNRQDPSGDLELTESKRNDRRPG